MSKALLGSLMLAAATKVLEHMEKRKRGHIPPSRSAMISSTDLATLLRAEKYGKKDEKVKQIAAG